MAVTIDGSAGVTTNAGGSVNPSTTIDGINFSCRAWVNFDGTKDTTGAASTANTNRLIRGSGNVASVLRNGTGDYTITFTTAMTDANYAVAALSQRNGLAGNVSFSEILGSTAYDRLTTSSVRVASRDQAANANDALCFTIAVFR
jgi:hypothetical protein